MEFNLGFFVVIDSYAAARRFLKIVELLNGAHYSVAYAIPFNTLSVTSFFFKKEKASELMSNKAKGALIFK